MFPFCSYPKSSIFDIVDKSKRSTVAAPGASARVNLLRKVVSRFLMLDHPAQTEDHSPLSHGR
jgi:hypothetical protein